MSDKSDLLSKLVENQKIELTDEEIAELLTFKPASGAEVIEQGLTGLWADRGIGDSVEWLKQLRKKTSFNVTAYLVDTSILIDIQRNHPRAIQWYRQQTDLGLSSICLV